MHEPPVAFIWPCRCLIKAPVAMVALATGSSEPAFDSDTYSVLGSRWAPLGLGSASPRSKTRLVHPCQPLPPLVHKLS